MADNYTQFSEGIDKLTTDEAAWCDARLTYLEAICRLYGAWSSFHRCSSPAELRYPSVELLPEDKPWVDFGAGDLGFEWELHDSSHNDADLWMYADDSGDVEKVGMFVQEFLGRWRPKDCFILTWASTCSKPRLGEFSGGALFVTAHGYETMTPSEWLSEKQAAHRTAV